MTYFWSCNCIYWKLSHITFDSIPFSYAIEIPWLNELNTMSIFLFCVAKDIDTMSLLKVCIGDWATGSSYPSITRMKTSFNYNFFKHISLCRKHYQNVLKFMCSGAIVIEGYLLWVFECSRHMSIDAYIVYDQWLCAVLHIIWLECITRILNVCEETWIRILYIFCFLVRVMTPWITYKRFV